METLAALWDLVVHLDQHLAAFVAQHGVWVYALLFAIVFCETGVVVTPFLPGDSLLSVRGALRRQRQLLDRALGRAARIPLPRISLVRSEALGAHSRVLREAWRKDDH